MSPAQPLDRATWRWLAAIVAIGLALRIAGAQGALWLDEAWSAKLAHDAGTPLGVFLHINHDNNHHLNSLWLQLVGPAAPPWLARALSIVTGTFAIGVAALIAARRGRVAALIAAWLFAVSPILVTLGSEARGYAPMTLALLGAILVVDRALGGNADPRARRLLAWCFALGALAQLTMVFGICALVGWFGVVHWQRGGLSPAVRATLGLFGPALLALGFALALIFVPALLSPTGFQFGRYEPFGFLLFLHGVIEMLGYTVAWPVNSLWLIAALLVAVVLARSLGAIRPWFYGLAIAAFPTLLALLHAGNVGHPRYYLIAGLALLLLIGEALATGWLRGGWRRAAAAAGLFALSVPALALDLDLARNRRGDVDPAIAAMQMRAPAGTTMLLDRDTGLAIAELAAGRAHYPLRIQQSPCPPQRFLLLDRFRGESFPRLIGRCGAIYAPLAGARGRGLSGTHWTLYERRR